MESLQCKLLGILLNIDQKLNKIEVPVTEKEKVCYQEYVKYVEDHLLLNFYFCVDNYQKLQFTSKKSPFCRFIKA